MTAKLSKDLIAALHAAGDNQLEVVDPESQRTYFVVAANVHRQAMDALHRQQVQAAITQGIVEMEAAAGIPVEEARRLTRARLLAPGQ